MTTKTTFSFLSIIALILFFCLLALPQLPQYFSYQDPVDPNRLIDNYDPNITAAIFNNQIFSVQGGIPQVLGVSDIAYDPNKRIEVDLTNQRLYGFEGDRQVYNFLISSGTWNRTPTGTFTIWTKIRSQKMSGGSKELGTYYYLPNVPYIMFFYNDKIPRQMGYSLHGTYWHNNFGTPMSHGCINMKTSEVAQIFNWASVGTTVTIYGKYSSKLAKK